MAHVLEPHAGILPLAGVETDTVVDDLHFGTLRRAADENLNLAGLGVFQGVVQCLDSDLIQVLVQFLRARQRRTLLDDIGPDAGAAFYSFQAGLQVFDEIHDPSRAAIL